MPHGPRELSCIAAPRVLAQIAELGKLVYTKIAEGGLSVALAGVGWPAALCDSLHDFGTGFTSSYFAVRVGDSMVECCLE